MTWNAIHFLLVSDKKGRVDSLSDRLLYTNWRRRYAALAVSTQF